MLLGMSGAGEVDAGQRAGGRRADGRPGRAAWTARADTPRPRTGSCSCCRTGGVLIDTPGMRTIDAAVGGGRTGVSHVFAEHRGARRSTCRFPRYRAHLGEPGCAVAEAVLAVHARRRPAASRGASSAGSWPCWRGARTARRVGGGSAGSGGSLDRSDAPAGGLRRRPKR
ncbi:MAG: hypothetical protein WKG07_36055 [Hymenobacter sp.]